MSLAQRIVGVAVSGVCAVAALAAPASAHTGDPQPTVEHCDFTFKSLKAIDLWDDGDSDYVIFQLKGNNYPGGGSSIRFFTGTVHTAAAFNYPAARATIIARSFSVNVLLDEPWPASNVDVPPVQQLSCGGGLTGTNRTLRFDNGDAEYELTYDLTPPHF
ncbi:hypothetical protein [Allorhizocola rhizosphaerae]|uniref:hypothetical protein n=1 Tax=Allorhizocola rhizosphaerae TaxID=1872709 RepID=UPI000E3E5C3E|nr:hypothetical protein [Allorhizocola rhizosphaerae]